MATKWTHDKNWYLLDNWPIGLSAEKHEDVDGNVETRYYVSYVDTGEPAPIYGAEGMGMERLGSQYWSSSDLRDAKKAVEHDRKHEISSKTRNANPDTAAAKRRAMRG